MINNYLILFLLALAAAAASLSALASTRPNPRITWSAGVAGLVLALVAAILVLINWTAST